MAAAERLMSSPERTITGTQVTGPVTWNATSGAGRPFVADPPTDGVS